MGPAAKALQEGVKPHQLAPVLAVEADATVVATLLQEAGLGGKPVRNAAVKTLSQLAKLKPEWFVDELKRFLDWLESDQRIVRWAAMDVVGYVAPVDSGHRIGRVVIRKLQRDLEDSSMVTAAHAVDNLIRIAEAKPAFHTEILGAFFRMGGSRREASCQDVLLGKAAEGCYRLWPGLSQANRKAVLAFLDRIALGEGRAGLKANRALGRLQARK